MELHNYQEARLKLFEDPHLKRVWVHPRDGSRPFPLAASQITVETDFQSVELESFQQQIEARAGPAFRKLGKWDNREFDAIMKWAVLHLIRNRKSRYEFFASPADYNTRFIPEFEKELSLSRERYVAVDRYETSTERFFITSDHPVVELQVPGKPDFVRCFAASPKILLLFSARPQPPQFELPVEDFFNAMVYAVGDQFVFSHSGSVRTRDLHQIATTYQMFPVIE